jgi:mono/diheme cytochrome c family protein
MRRRLLASLVWLAVVAAAAAAAAADSPTPAPAPAPAPARNARRILMHSECGRCHGVAALGLPSAPRVKSCADCHAWIHGTRDDADERARQARIYPLWNQYVHNVKSYLAVPDLASAGARLDPAWVSAFLREPVKIRPGLAESMIRTPLAPADADAVAAFLRASAPPLRGLAAEAAALPVSARPEDVAGGERLYAKLLCASCHALGARAAAPGIPEAPDLAHARRRMRPGDIAAFIADPAAFGGSGAQRMPSYGLTARDAARLRDFLLAAPLSPAPPAAAAAPEVESDPAQLPLLERRVTWKEVNDRVFAAVCAHCHSDGKLTDGDGGPGNTGGLGYAGAGVDLGSFQGLLRGARRPGGRRVSLLVAEPGASQPPLLARLYRRVREHAAERAAAATIAGAAAPGAGPGMPLGQPALDAERLQLVRSWIAQGAPGPDGRKAIRVERIRSAAHASRAIKEDPS